jgi:hypothetical protein
MWRRVVLVWTDVSEERIASIFGVENPRARNQREQVAGDFSTLKMEAIRSNEKSVHTRTTRRHIPENGILHSHRRETSNLTNKVFLSDRIFCDEIIFVSAAKFQFCPRTSSSDCSPSVIKQKSTVLLLLVTLLNGRVRIPGHGHEASEHPKSRASIR